MYVSHFRWCYDAEEHKDRLVEVMFPLLLDASTEGLADLVSSRVTTRLCILLSLVA